MLFWFLLFLVAFILYWVTTSPVLPPFWVACVRVCLVVIVYSGARSRVILSSSRYPRSKPKSKEPRTGGCHSRCGASSPPIYVFITAVAGLEKHVCLWKELCDDVGLCSLVASGYKKVVANLVSRAHRVSAWPPSTPFVLFLSCFPPALFGGWLFVVANDGPMYVRNTLAAYSWHGLADTPPPHTPDERKRLYMYVPSLICFFSRAVWLVCLYVIVTPPPFPYTFSSLPSLPLSLLPVCPSCLPCLFALCNIYLCFCPSRRCV